MEKYGNCQCKQQYMKSLIKVKSLSLCGWPTSFINCITFVVCFPTCAARKFKFHGLADTLNCFNTDLNCHEHVTCEDLKVECFIFNIRISEWQLLSSEGGSSFSAVKYSSVSRPFDFSKGHTTFFDY